MSVSRCPGHLRHWYGVDGAVGVFRPHHPDKRTVTGYCRRYPHEGRDE